MTDPALTLDPAAHERIVALYKAGNGLAEKGRYGSAIALYSEAWVLIPDPKERWKLSTSIISAIADSWFLAGRYDEVLRALEFGMNCPGAADNPFLHLRLGQALLEQGEEDRAADSLIRAYQAHGEAIFADEDPKYLAFLAARGSIGP